MREFVTQDGTRIHLPDNRQREEPRVVSLADANNYQCWCHERLGNDFWFLPTGSCLLPSKTCNGEPR